MKIQTFSIVAGNNNCNAHCPYCISKMTPKSGIDKKLLPVNWRNFRKACRLAQINDVSTVLITGKGEPTLYPEQIHTYLLSLRKWEFPVIELQTNGIFLEQLDVDEILQQWYKAELTTIVLSAVHYNVDKNREIFSSNYPALEKSVKRIHDNGLSVRLNCTLIDGYVDSAKKVLSMVAFAKENNIEQLTIRQLAVPDCSVSCNEKVSQWTNEHIVSDDNLNDIYSTLSSQGHKLMTLPNGAEVYDVDGQNVCLTDALTIEPKSDNLRQVIFFPDGHLRYDWQYSGAILF